MFVFLAGKDGISSGRSEFCFNLLIELVWLTFHLNFNLVNIMLWSNKDCCRLSLIYSWWIVMFIQSMKFISVNKKKEKSWCLWIVIPEIECIFLACAFRTAAAWVLYVIWSIMTLPCYLSKRHILYLQAPCITKRFGFLPDV